MSAYLNRAAACAGAALVLFGIGVGRARADPTYSYFYVAGNASYTGVATNSTLTVPLYLEEVSADSTSLLANEDGLASAGLSVSVAAAGPATIAGISANAGAPTTGFDYVSSSTGSTASSASLVEFNDFSDADGVAASAQVNGVSEVLLGTLTLSTGAIAGETKFQVGPNATEYGSTATFANGYDLDDSSDPANPAGSSDLYYSAAPTEFTVDTAASPAPLPSPLVGTLVCGALALVGSGRLRSIPLFRKPA